MHQRWATWRRAAPTLAALAVLTACGAGCAPEPPTAEEEPPKPLPEKLVAGWKKAGARVGWMRVEEFGSISFLPEKEGQAGDLPALQCHEWEEDIGEEGG